MTSQLNEHLICQVKPGVRYSKIRNYERKETELKKYMQNNTLSENMHYNSDERNEMII